MRISPKRTSPPSASSTAGTEGGISNGAQSGDGCSSACRSSRWTAIRAPVSVETAALSPIWSQWPCVETISFNVQARAASSSRIHASDGMAVSIAIASRERGSARTWTFVASGPTTRLIRSTGSSGPAEGVVVLHVPGHPEAELGAAGRAVARPRRAGRGLDQRPDDEEADARPLRLQPRVVGPVEEIEQAGRVGRQPGPLVRHPDLDRPVGRGRRPDRDLAVVAVLDRVRDEVPEDQLE